MSSNTPILSLPYVPENTLDPAAGLNLVIDILDALVQSAVISMGLTTPPATGADGDMYIVGVGATGDWAGQDNNLARFVDDGNFWLFYEAGVEIHYVLNRDDGGLYKFIQGSPDSWVLAAGLADAPSDGNPYVRQDGMWVVQGGSLTVQDTDSPPTVVADEVNVLMVGDGLEVVEVSPGVAMIQLGPLPPPAVVEWLSDTLNATPANAGEYTRFLGTEVEYNFGGEDYSVGAEYHGRNAGTSTVTIVGVSGFTVNPPAGGTLVIPPDGTFTVKIVGENEADLFGVTEDA